jgi:hypothetical protein
VDCLPRVKKTKSPRNVDGADRQLRAVQTSTFPKLPIQTPAAHPLRHDAVRRRLRRPHKFEKRGVIGSRQNTDLPLERPKPPALQLLALYLLYCDLVPRPLVDAVVDDRRCAAAHLPIPREVGEVDPPGPVVHRNRGEHPARVDRAGLEELIEAPHPLRNERHVRTVRARLNVFLERRG